ncbi:MAG TPA: spore germination protein [Bacillota bacterium]|nr:spore germination protein [Bacillota bacterium]
MFRNFFHKKVRISNLIESNTRHDDSNQLAKIPHSIDETLAALQTRLGESKDIIYRCFLLNQTNIRASIVYIDDLTDANMINNQVMKTVLSDLNDPPTKNDDLLSLYLFKFIDVGDVSKTHSISEVIEKILQGNTIFLIDGVSQAICIGTSKWETRSIEEPTVENTIRGPKESFTEDLKNNISLLRRKIKNENLRFLSLNIGETTKTDICISYLHKKADPSLVTEVKSRLENIDMEGILESRYLEEWIVDHPYSVFPQLDHTERPDRVAAMLMEGRIAIFCNGTPWVLIVPTIFMQFFTSPGDYYQNFYFSTFIRWLRFIASMLTLTIPAFYIALITMHQEMIPTQLALRIAGSRANVPFPAVVEAFLMEITFEILREAGIRLPKAAGQAVSIVGALIIGQAAVDAGIVSPIKIIVVSLTGICSFALPNYSLGLTIRLLRFPLMILASLLGIPGIAVALLALLTYMTSIKSFGLPYLSPLSPLTQGDFKDTLFRAPLFKLGNNKSKFGFKPKNKNEFDIEDEEQ